MRSILSSIAAAGLLATVATAQPYHGRSLPFRSEAPASNAPVSPGSSRLVYVLTASFQFGALDLGSGAFVQIGTGLPETVGDGLIAGPRTSLLSLGFDGNLISIDPATSKTSVVGPTGLLDCTTPASPCGPNAANWLGYFDGKYYVVDFAQNLYSLNPDTGKARLIGPTGIPYLTFPPFSRDSDGVSFDVFGEALFSSQGKFYAYFIALAVNLENNTSRVLTSGAIYQINPKTGDTRFVSSPDRNLSTLVNINDTVYGFDGLNNQVVTVDVETGQTHFVSRLDPSVGPVAGATPARPVSKSLH
jgi:outer membrane protein assembly factor BamB